MNRQRRYVAAVSGVAVALLVSWFGVRDYIARSSLARIDDQEFWELVVTFSEPGAAFRSAGAVRTDNLVSNERSFQRVIPELEDAGREGAYLGVGPEQNFTYITTMKPTIAFIVDIRRDNMLLHLMYKALVEMSADRAEFLSLLFARARPPEVGRRSTVQALFDAFRPARCSEALANRNLRAVFDRLERAHGFILSQEDERGIKRAYESFCANGPDIRWDSSGDSWIPSYADLMAESDTRGRSYSYLASEENFRVLKRYQVANRIVPLVGDFGGERTVRAVGGYLKQHGTKVAAFYTSNVEAYLRENAPNKFMENVSSLPIDEHSLFIRTRFKIASFVQDRPQYQSATTAERMLPWVNMWKHRQTQ